MKAVDFKGVMNKYLFDTNRKIPSAHLRSVCKYKCGKNKTCRYICLSINGFICTKNTPIKATLDELVKDNKFGAKGDNCEGLGNFERGIESEKEIK